MVLCEYVLLLMRESNGGPRAIGHVCVFVKRRESITVFRSQREVERGRAGLEFQVGWIYMD